MFESDVGKADQEKHNRTYEYTNWYFVACEKLDFSLFFRSVSSKYKTAGATNDAPTAAARQQKKRPASQNNTCILVSIDRLIPEVQFSRKQVAERLRSGDRLCRRLHWAVHSLICYFLSKTARYALACINCRSRSVGARQDRQTEACSITFPKKLEHSLAESRRGSKKMPSIFSYTNMPWRSMKYLRF